MTVWWVSTWLRMLPREYPVLKALLNRLADGDAEAAVRQYPRHPSFCGRVRRMDQQYFPDRVIEGLRVP